MLAAELNSLPENEAFFFASSRILCSQFLLIVMNCASNKMIKENAHDKFSIKIRK